MTYFSMNILRAGALLAAALLAGCSGMELDRAQSLSPQGSTFSKALFDGYIKLSKAEFAEFDYADSDAFAMRAAASTKGTDVFPEDMSMRKLPKNKVGELSSARARLMAALDAGGREHKPGPAAHAQVMFDCWMQEQEENFQPDDITACRSGFFSALAEIETMPMKMAAKPMHKPMKKSRKFVVYFGFDSAGITDAARKTIREAIAVAKAIKAKRVYVTGHTDRAGAGNYNLDLSERRAQAVVGQLTGGGLSPRMVSFGSLGENVVAIQTDDGVRTGGNRRVEIDVAN